MRPITTFLSAVVLTRDMLSPRPWCILTNIAGCTAGVWWQRVVFTGRILECDMAGTLGAPYAGGIEQPPCLAGRSPLSFEPKRFAVPLAVWPIMGSYLERLGFLLTLHFPVSLSLLVILRKYMCFRELLLTGLVSTISAI